MTNQVRPTFLAWLERSDGRAALRNEALLASILLVAVHEVLPLRSVLGNSSPLVRVLVRVAEFAILLGIIAYATYLVRRDRVSADVMDNR